MTSQVLRRAQSGTQRTYRAALQDRKPVAQVQACRRGLPRLQRHRQRAWPV